MVFDKEIVIFILRFKEPKKIFKKHFFHLIYATMVKGNVSFKSEFLDKTFSFYFSVN